MLVAALVATAVMALLPAAAAAQQPEIIARAVLDRADATLGDRIRVTVTVQHPDSVLVDVRTPDSVTSYRVIDTLPPKTTPGTRGGPSVTQFEFVIAPFALGAQQLPPLLLSWIDDNGVSGEQTVELPALDVASTVDPGDTELRPLKPQLAIEGAPFAWQLPAAIAGAVAVVLVITGGALLMRRRRPTRVADFVPEVPLSIEDTARRRRGDGRRAPARRRRLRRLLRHDLHGRARLPRVAV